MVDGTSDLITVELASDEAKLIVAALRQFEPYWPADMDDMSRVELLAGIRHGIEHVVETLDSTTASTS